MSYAPFIIPALSAVIAFAAFYFATKAARATASGAVHAVDAEAYTRASSIYEDTITNLRADIDRLRADLALARAEIRELRRSNDRMLAELTKLGRVINENGDDGLPWPGNSGKRTARPCCRKRARPLSHPNPN